MRLLDLKPKWMRLNGKAVAIIFQCPRCVAKGCGSHKLTWLTCTFQALGNREQRDLIEATIAADPADFVATDTEEHDVVGCNTLAWGKDCKDLARMSVNPSLDASAAGHWHGHITKGEIRGGI